MITMTVTTFLFVMCANVASSNANYFHVMPSMNASCPQEPCLTLSQLIGNISQYYGGYNNNMTLIFHPGNHNLSTELSVAATNNFSMIGTSVRYDDTAFVRCFGQLGRFQVRNSTFVWIKGLHFIGCRGNEIVQVKDLVLENATFHGVSLGSWNSSLVLHRVANGEIVKSAFLLNSNRAYYGGGGAMYISESTVSITDGYFASNSAYYHHGGVVYSLNSTLTITTSHFADNSAFNGGVIYSSSSSFNVSHSNFTNNTALHSGASWSSSDIVKGTGGVIYAHASFFIINCSIFTNNTASYNRVSQSRSDTGSMTGTGGVMYTYYSSFSIGFSIFIGNRDFPFCLDPTN